MQNSQAKILSSGKIELKSKFPTTSIAFYAEKVAVYALEKLFTNGIKFHWFDGRATTLEELNVVIQYTGIVDFALSFSDRVGWSDFVHDKNLLYTIKNYYKTRETELPNPDTLEYLHSIGWRRDIYDRPSNQEMGEEGYLKISFTDTGIEGTWTWIED